MKKQKPKSVQKKSFQSHSHLTLNFNKKRHKGYSSVSKSTIASKNKQMLFSIPHAQEGELNIDVNQLNFMIDKLWAKFIVFYHYGEVFKIPPQFRKDETVMDMKKTIAEDFELKLWTYFKIYAIRKDENANLVSMSNEGSYLLFDAKIWIMHMKVLIDKYSFKISQLYSIFNRAIEYECDVQLLFDFFIDILINAENIIEVIEGMDENDRNGIPKEIVYLWNENKEHVMNVVRQDELKKAKLKSKEKIEHIDLEGKESQSEDVKDQDLEEKEEEEEDDDDNKDEEEEEEGVDNSNNYRNDDTDSKKIIEVSYEQENEDEEYNENKSTFKPIPKKDMKKDLTPQPNNNKKREYHRAFNLGTDLKEAKVIYNNICSNGNYAFLELNPKIQKELGQQYVLTPIKAQISKNEAYDDRKFINDKYTDYIYQPFTEEIASLIKSHHNITPSKSFK